MFQISNKVLEDLVILESLSTNTAFEFCKLVTAELSKLHLLEKTISSNDVSNRFGFSNKILESAAKRLRSVHSEVTSDTVATTLQAIAHLYVEAAKQIMGPEQLSTFLKDSLPLSTSVLVDHYEKNYMVLQMAMKNIMQNNQSGARNSFVRHLPHYTGLEWRLDAIAGSRALPSHSTPQASPVITLKFNLHQTSFTSSLNLDSESEKNDEKNKDVLLQTDPVNLCHMVDVLENALKEARSQQFRKLQRQF